MSVSIFQEPVIYPMLRTLHVVLPVGWARPTQEIHGGKKPNEGKSMEI